MSKPNVVLARVTAIGGMYINSVLHQRGEQLYVDLDALGIKSLDEAGGLEPGDESGEGVATAPLASVAPRAPGATMPQGAPPGSVQSGTGRILMPAGEGENAGSVEVRPDTTVAELEAEPPIRRDTDISETGTGEGDGEDEDVAALVAANTKAQLLDLAEVETVDDVSDDNNKTEIATKIVAKRRG